MGVYHFRRFLAAAFAAAVGLAACQGSAGTGGFSQIPNGQFGVSPNGTAPTTQTQQAQPAQSRERSVERSDRLAIDASALHFPEVGGFSVTIALGTAPPSSPLPTSLATGGLKPGLRTSAVVSPAPTSVATATAAASSFASATPAVDATSTSEASAKPSSSPSGPVIALKTTIYPAGAPKPPDAASAAHRVALVRVSFQPTVDLKLYGLAAVRFTIPATEIHAGRGYTVAIFEEGRHHRDQLLSGDPTASGASEVIAANIAPRPLQLVKNHRFVALLYADDLPATPPPSSVPSGGGYSQPGYPTQNGSQQSTSSQQPGVPQPTGPYGQPTFSASGQPTSGVFGQPPYGGSGQATPLSGGSR